MTRKPAYVLTTSMDIAPDKEDLFNEVYDQEHVPALLEVPGVCYGSPGCARSRSP